MKSWAEDVAQWCSRRQEGQGPGCRPPKVEAPAALLGVPPQFLGEWARGAVGMRIPLAFYVNLALYHKYTSSC